MRKINTKNILAATLAAMTMALSCSTAYADSNVDLSASEVEKTESEIVLENLIMGYPAITDIEDVPTPYASKAPTQLWDWSKGNYGTKHNEEEGGLFYPLYQGSTTKTGYKFSTNTEKLVVDLTLSAAYNYTNKRKITIKLYQSHKDPNAWENLTGSNWKYVTSQSDEFTPDEHKENKTFPFTFTFSNLSSEYDYYFEFCNTSAGDSDKQYYSFDGEFTIRR